MMDKWIYGQLPLLNSKMSASMKTRDFNRKSLTSDCHLVMVEVEGISIYLNRRGISMQAMPFRIFLVLFILVLIYPSASPAATERRIALVIGNSAYNSGPLKNPVNDATAMAAQLQKLGFTVILKKNASLRGMEDALTDFGDRQGWSFHRL